MHSPQQILAFEKWKIEDISLLLDSPLALSTMRITDPLHRSAIPVKLSRSVSVSFFYSVSHLKMYTETLSGFVTLTSFTLELTYRSCHLLHVHPNPASYSDSLKVLRIFSFSPGECWESSLVWPFFICVVSILARQACYLPETLLGIIAK